MPSADDVDVRRIPPRPVDDIPVAGMAGVIEVRVVATPLLSHVLEQKVRSAIIDIQIDPEDRRSDTSDGNAVCARGCQCGEVKPQLGCECTIRKVCAELARPEGELVGQCVANLPSSGMKRCITAHQDGNFPGRRQISKLVDPNDCLSGDVQGESRNKRSKHQ